MNWNQRGRTLSTAEATTTPQTEPIPPMTTMEKPVMDSTNPKLSLLLILNQILDGLLLVQF